MKTDLKLSGKMREIKTLFGTDKESDYEETCVCCGKSLNGAAFESNVCHACGIEADEFNSDIAKDR